jgi:hypothetical protein
LKVPAKEPCEQREIERERERERKRERPRETGGVKYTLAAYLPFILACFRASLPDRSARQAAAGRAHFRKGKTFETRQKCTFVRPSHLSVLVRKGVTHPPGNTL